MNVSALLHTLESHPAAALLIHLPDGHTVPPHFHITEAGHVRKDFIDCGGTQRAVEACVLQAWVAADVDHRLTSGKLAQILRMAAPLLGENDLSVEIEYQQTLISQYPLVSADAKDGTVHFYVTTKNTDCLAKERCQIPAPAAEPEEACCAGSGCCG